MALSFNCELRLSLVYAVPYVVSNGAVVSRLNTEIDFDYRRQAQTLVQVRGGGRPKR